MNRVWLERWWPRLVAAGVVLVVLAPAAVASYLHARHVVSRHDETMAGWLPITTDGMLLAALVVIWARRATRDPAGRWVWLAFWLGGVVTVAANLAAVLPTSGLSLAVEAVAVAVWPPITVAITLELAMLLAMAIRLSIALDLQSQDTNAGDPADQFKTPAQTVSDGSPAVPTPGSGPGTAGAEEPAGTAQPTSDTPSILPADPRDRVRALMAQGKGRPTIVKITNLSEGYVRKIMDDVRTGSNGNGAH